MQRLARTLPILAICGLILLVFQESRGLGWLCLAGLIVGRTAIRIWIPMAAHRAFRRGDSGRARILYALLRAIRLQPSARQSLLVSLGACSVEREDWKSAEHLLGRVQEESLAESARAIWLNNRAYILLRTGGSAVEALRLVDEATAMRPGVPGFRHTRGVALIQSDKVDEGIRELHAMWERSGGEMSELLEAERCYDLAMAWEATGETEYANDYLRRAVRAAPGTRWAERAEARLAPRLPELPAV